MYTVIWACVCALAKAETQTHRMEIKKIKKLRQESEKAAAAAAAKLITTLLYHSHLRVY